jgi:hypothetical protein
MNICFAFAFIAVVLIAVSPARAVDEFKCPPGAKDSGYQPGNVVRWCQIQKDGRLLYHGPVWRWHRNGTLESKENYIYGNADGDTPSWYENGKQSSHGLFKNGSKVGLWKYWDEKGQLSTDVTYSGDGHVRTDYYPNGKMKASGTVKSSGKIGKWTYWDDSGKEKARCDFGEGLFVVSSKSCQRIADEVEPTGFSRPLPIGEVASASASSLRIAGQVYEFSTPPGWIADAEAGKDDGAPLVFYRKGSKWRGNGPNLYIRPIFKAGSSFQKVQETELQEFQEGVAEYSETNLTKYNLSNGSTVVTRSITYKPLMQTDSPFSIVTDNTIHESLSYVDVSKEVVLVTVLTSPTEKNFTASMEAVRSLVNSMRAHDQ